jgi:GNAT superfamily N-acetyltransferase
MRHQLRALTGTLGVGAAVLAMAATSAGAVTPAHVTATGSAATRRAEATRTTGPFIGRPVFPVSRGRITESPKLYSGPPTDKNCALDYGLSQCFTPQDIRAAYGVNKLISAKDEGKGETIVIVDSYGSPTIASDLRGFDRGYKIVNPPSFRVLHPLGTVKFNPDNAAEENWASETTLDVEWSHAMAPEADIVLLTSPVNETEGTAGLGDFLKLEQYALNHNLGNVISQSWGATENTLQTTAGRKLVAEFETFYARAARHHVTILASTGDTGSQNAKNAAGTEFYTTPTVNFPASSPYVTAVGGTALTMRSGTWSSEAVWNDGTGAGGGGISQLFTEPSWQKKLPTKVQTQLKSHRGIPDISWNASPETSILIYITDDGLASWDPIGGTSEGAPQWAGLVADIDQARHSSIGWLNPTIYSLIGHQNTYFHDIVQGNNAFDGVAGYSAATGWDPASGLGTPRTLSRPRRSREAGPVSDPAPEIAIRDAEPADARRLAELLAGGALRPKEDPDRPEAYVDALAEIATTPGNAVLVAVLDGEVVGMCQLIIFRHIQEQGGRCAEIESVHVDALRRGHGIGTALLEAAVARARAAGCFRVQLTSNTARTDAHRWYTRTGFVPSHTGFKLALR